MSSFVWAKFMMLAQLDILTVVAWSVVGLFSIATIMSYFTRLATPSQIGGDGDMTWVPIPEDLPTGDVAPYGAPVLKSAYQGFMTRGVTGAILFHAVLIGGGVLIANFLTREPVAQQARVVNYADLGAPPSLSQKQAPNQAVLGPPPPPPPSAAIPIPVPDATAPKNTTILSQDELGDLGPMFEGGEGEGSIWGGGGGGTFGGGDVAVSDGGELAPGDFQPVEQLPELITIPEPEYPQLAREAQVEGVVKLLVLVGKDGKVKNIRVEQSIQMLDDSAKAAAQAASFKPALWQKKPVAVWVSIPIRFSLRES
ncbi:MAG: energy transducer TonB [Candidatus Eisenbacteria bacterium]|nr:energy transducer TonB [Candidatus Eisenbacteria bacterium]